MKRLLAGILSIAIANTTAAWGFLGHKTINNRAVFALPPELFGFYKKHLEYITQHAVDPDNRRYLFENEGCKHFMDCDHYEKRAPLDTIPHQWYKAVAIYGEDSLKLHGIVPWNTYMVFKQLTKAFSEKNVPRILKLSADIGHYIADAHVPLHTSGNYNGQKTGQEGIHALWESRIPQLFLDSFQLMNGTVSYLDNPHEYLWKIVEESFSEIDSVLIIEKALSVKMENKKYAFETVGNSIQKVVSSEYCTAYKNAMNSMVERRMRKAIYSVAGFWYTAWVDAGQPILETETPSPEADPMDALAEKIKSQGKIKGREEQGGE
ncbi:MAG: S1/P1 Nuclease [Bacteroidetes bacterium]|nr:S1/P1 Nuclease [Bacteroidota bacterium]